MGWHFSVIPALGKEWRREDQELKDSIGYIANLRPTWATEDLASKKF